MQQIFYRNYKSIAQFVYMLYFYILMQTDVSDQYNHL